MKKTNNMMKTKKPNIFKLKTSKNKKKTKKSKKLIRNKIKMKGGALNMSIMTTPFNIPSKSYPLKKSPEDIERYSMIMRANDFDDATIKIFKTFLNLTTHISFDHLIHSIKIVIEDFEKRIKEKPFYLFIPIIDRIPIENKSNYWISKIFYLLMNTKPIEIITSFQELTDEMKDIIVCDDAIYSGYQMKSTFDKFPNTTGKYIFHILCPFISREGIVRINENYEKQIYYAEIMLPLSEILKNHIIYGDALNFESVIGNINNYPYYFDHRVADLASSYPHFYEVGRVGRVPVSIPRPGNTPIRKPIYLNSLLENCNHANITPDSYPSLGVILESLTKCPPIPYKRDITAATPGIIVITPEEFIDRYR
jgi:hypothetical protein